MAAAARLTRRSWLAAAAWLPLAGAAAELPDVIAAAKPSVVVVGTFKATDNPRFTFHGTGFVVGDGNTVVTNFHVLPSALDSTPDLKLMIQVQRENRELEPRAARFLTADRNHDLVLLRIEGAPLPALTLGAPALVRDGTAIAFTGFPIAGLLGFSPVTHRGIVSSVTSIALPAPTSQQLTARSVARLREGPFDIYQLDAVAYPGNSGGPVFDATSGHVIGVINMVLVRSTRESALSSPTGITYAIPIRFVRDLLEHP